MINKFALVCFLLLSASLAQAQKAIAISQGTLIVLEGTITPPIPLASVSNIDRVARSLKVAIDGPASIVSRNTTPTIEKSGTVYLDPLNAGPFNSTSEVQLKLKNKTLVTLSIFSTNQELFDFIGQNPRNYENAVIAKGNNWYLIDPDKVTTTPSAPTSHDVNGASMASLASTPDDRGYSQITYDLENGGNTIYPRAICVRYFDPLTGWNHRNHYGINLWRITNPIPAGFSLKQEFSNSLRCPHRDYKVQEDFIDGIYKRAWGTTAYKVPNHCTSTRYSGYMTCCCNATLTAVYGTCRFAPTAPINWPARGLTCG